nr:hybrid sensor histidine kinase/response regulator [Puniceicoccus vermicola]
MEEKGLVFRVHTAPNVPDLLFGERIHLRKILANLIENALRYTEKGAVDLRFSVDRRDGKNLTLLCEVEDTGMGISPENVKEIFDPFVCLSSDESAGESGLGLGLTVCRAMVDWLGGDIGVESVSGEGSHFWVSAPLKTCGEEVKVDDKGWADVKLKGQKVLVAEDNPINQEVIEMILKKANLSYQTVRNGQIVLELLPKEPYDLILMDVRMPVMDGIETTLRIRSGEAGEAFRDIPIIGVTANAMKHQIRECVEAGMNEVLAKPFSVEVLVDLVRRYLDGRTLEESF